MIIRSSLLQSRLVYRCINCAAVLVLSLAASLVHADIIFTAKVMGPVTNVYAVDESSGKLKKLTDDIHWRDLDGNWSNGWVTFSSNREKEAKVDMYKTSEDYDVYVVKDNGKSLKQLTDSAYDEVVPKFSPNGKQIGYLHQPTEKHELVVINRDGTGKRVVVKADTILDFSWSPDGKKIAYVPTKGTDSLLATVDVAGGEPRTLVKVSTELPPAGEKNTDAFQMQFVSVQWSPAGDKIAYISHPLKQAERRLRVFDLKTGKDSVVSVDGAQVQHPVIWSADGGKLLYSALVGYKFYYDEKIHRKVYKGGMHIFVSSLGENIETHQLTKGDFLFKSPVFSPDEKQIAFLYADALDERTLTLKTMKADGTEVKEWYNSVAQRSHLQWK